MDVPNVIVDLKIIIDKAVVMQRALSQLFSALNVEPISSNTIIDNPIPINDCNCVDPCGEEEDTTPGILICFGGHTTKLPVPTQDAVLAFDFTTNQLYWQNQLNGVLSADKPTRSKNGGKTTIPASPKRKSRKPR